MVEGINNIAQLIEHKASVRPDFEVLTFVNVEADGRLSDERRTYGELWTRAQKLAAALQGRGVAPNDTVVLMLRNRPEFVEAVIASSLIGAIYVPLDVRSMGDKLAYMINHVSAKVVIAEAASLAALDAIAEKLVNRPTVLLVDSDETLANFASSHYEMELANAGQVNAVVPDPASTMFLMFTSGTTGNPKAVVRTHAGYVRGMEGLLGLGVEHGDTLYSGLPLCHINAHATLANGLALELPTVFSRQFTKSRLWDVCRAYGCTVFTLLGGMIPEVFAVPEKPDDKDNPVRLIVSSGMSAKLWGAYERRFGVTITEVYGSTENGGSLFNRMSEGPHGSMGKPPAGLVAAILDDDDQPCPPMTPGHLCFRREAGESESVIYFQNEKANAEKMAGGWFRTGDMAYQDAEGWFYFLHRAGGGVRRNGDFINTSLVETVLAQSPEVADVFVYGVETSANVAGERTLVAAVVLERPDCLDEVTAWARSNLQRNEVPEIWQPLDAIPKTVSEKPIERECAALLRDAGLVEPA